MKRTLIALLVGAGMVSASWAQTTIINTGFTAGDGYSDGDIIGQNSWAQVPNTDPNAFDIAASAGAGFADQTTTAGSFSTNAVGQYAYLNVASAGNSVDDEWSGVMDFVVDAGTATTLPSTKFFNIGLTANPTNHLSLNDTDDVFVAFRCTSTGKLQFRFNGVGTKELAELTAAEAGWDPLTADVLTDQLRLSWTVRKTSDAGVYAAWASVTNLVSGSNVAANVVQYDDTRGPVYSNAAPDFAMGRHENADFNNGSNILSVVIDDLSFVKNSGVAANPITPVLSAAGGDTQVTISWGTLYDVDSYTIERSLTSTFGFSTITNLPSPATSYVDTGLVNNQAYFYKVTANYGAVPATSAEISATPIAVVTGTIFDEDFTAAEGYADTDLAGQKEWGAISGTGSNAFDVIDSAGSGFADTAAAVAQFSTNGNAVYWGKAMSNNVASAWTGTLDFQVTADTFPGLFGTNEVFVYDASGTNVIGTNVFTEAIALLSENQNKILLNIGLTSSQTDKLASDANNGQVTLQIATRADASLSVKLMSDQNPRALFDFFEAEDAGWNPEWTGNGGGNANTNNVLPDFATDMLRLTYTIRKESASGYYLATASLSNLVSGVVSTNTGTNMRVADYQEWQGQTAYDSGLMLFAMGKSGQADGLLNPAAESMVDIKIDAVSFVQELDAEQVLFAPTWPDNDAVVADDATAVVTWEAATQETEGYNVYRSVVDGGPYSEIALVTNGLSYTDTGLNNIWTYYYVIASVSGTNESVNSEQRSGMPIPKTIILSMGGAGTTWSSQSSGADFFDGTGNNNPLGTDAGIIRTRNAETTAFLVKDTSVAGEYQENTLRGIWQWQSAPMAYRRARLLANTSNGQGLRVEQVNGLSTNCAALFYVQQDELDIAGTLDLTSAPYTFEVQDSKLSAADLTTNAPAMRAAVRQGGVWYVSETAITGAGTLLVEDLGAENWTVLTPAVEGVSTSYMSVDGQAYAPVSLTAVDAIGWFAVNFEISLVNVVKLLVSDASNISGYQFWEAGNLLLPPSMGVDTDSDGKVNLWEFGLNGDPNDGGSLGVDPTSELVNIGGTNYVKYVHLRRKGTNLGIDYKLKDTVNLVFIPMTNDAAVASQSVGDYDANYESVTNLIPTTENEKFIRLQLEQL